jgi:hypothetical protein
MNFEKPITETILNRFSCRAYLSEPIAPEKRHVLEEAAAEQRCGPFGSGLRYQVKTATEEERGDLRRLGTYGLIKNPTGFLVGAVREQPMDLEDYGYTLEELVLLATELGVGSCWIGGFFGRSSFSRVVELQRGERLPAVISLGLIADAEKERQAPLRHRTGGDTRFPWQNLFFAEAFGASLSPEAAGEYATPLEMVRVAPSASNKQPWRIVQAGRAWHFYLRRTPGYPGNLAKALLRVEDLQRVDMGIAMCHFELAARELGLAGEWTVQEPAIEKPDDHTQYTASWMAAAQA